MSERGFSLPELLVAMALAGLVLAAALGGMGTLRQRQREAALLARLQERAAHAFSVIEPELQLAGYGGLRALAEAGWPAALPAPVTACGTLAGAAPPPPVRVHLPPWPLPCTASGGGAAPAAQALSVTRAAGRLAVPEAGRLQLLSRRTGAAPPQLLQDGRLPAGLALAEGQAELRDLLHLLFYVARRADGAAGEYPALRVRELTSIAGHAALRDTEVVDGIEDLQVEEGWRPDDAPTTALRFTAPGLRPAATPLRALTVWLRVRSEEPLGAARAQSFAYAGTAWHTRDAYLRVLARRTFHLRNPASGGPP